MLISAIALFCALPNHHQSAGLAYPIRDGIPGMLESEARTLTTDERLDK